MVDIAVIGGGPSGAFAAIWSKNANNRVTIFEKNEKLGKKLYITGKGRCNLTNAKIYDEFLENIVVNKKFLYSSFNKFDNFSMIDYCQNNGLKLEIQRGARVFPKSEKSSDVIKFLEDRLNEKGVLIKYREEVKSVYKENSCFYIKTSKTSYKFDKVVIATGGLSYPLTGSTGDGYKFAYKFGHKIIDPVPGLCPIRIKNNDTKNLEGISLKNINLHVKTKNKDLDEFGDLLFTKDGISGPVTLTMSSRINRLKVSQMFIDLKPALSFQKLEKRILRDIEQNPNLDIANNLKKLLLNAFIPIILVRSKIGAHKKSNQITKAERENLVKNIKEFYLDFNGLEKISRAVITSGGIDLKDVDPKTMESKLIEGLYFVGEVLDLDGFTGGYNLQIAFTTAYACGISIKERT
ncbi:MAG: NAD(P)/FAD-dependent oxidoreductase [Peptoniphilaceae bacterium]|nr:NAD(P)/FAD-dependent oxidoreductase [Peptoniphilaceae bacterium]MDY6019384.1 NAD(P)/FAD-dependent oxidoreductase [Anaerococcus sp.]